MSNDNPYGQPPSNEGQPSPYPQQGGSYDEAPNQGSYGQQGAYGAGPVQGGYGQQPAQGGYGGAPQMDNAFAPTQTQGQLSPWGKRVGNYAIDFIVPSIIINIVAALAGGGSVVNLILNLVFLGFVIWNRWIQGGNTGQSIGRKLVGVKLISEQTGQPIGAGMAFVRDIAHFLDSIACFVGWLFPLWDSKRQTFADKIVKTVVIDVPR